MSIEVKVPMLPESVADATVINWHKQEGDNVSRDETLVDLETDKVVLEVPSPDDGVLTKILQKDGATVVSDELLATIQAGTVTKTIKTESPKSQAVLSDASDATSDAIEKDVSPAVRRLLNENNLSSSQITGTGKGGRIIKEDVLAFLNKNAAPATSVDASIEPSTVTVTATGLREEKRVPMSRLRKRIAERLVEAQHNAAMLTTFNEVNLQAVIDLRKQYQDSFEKKHGVRLGFMSFFTKAVAESLKRFPAVNASVDGDDIVYHGYHDVGIAVSTDRGLVVPVVRDADILSMAQIEQAIQGYALKAREGKLALEDMQGGTFTITNGGVFGSLLATPIINPPQTGILGMHKIEERPVAEKGQVVVRPMMYVALSYDHRLIDGKESVQFLVSVKELLEDPTRLLLEV